MQRLGSWMVLHVDSTTDFDGMKRLNIVHSRCQGLRLCLRGFDDIETLRFHVQKQLLSVLEEWKQRERTAVEQIQIQGVVDPSTKDISLSTVCSTDAASRSVELGGSCIVDDNRVANDDVLQLGSSSNAPESNFASQVCNWIIQTVPSMAQLRVETSGSASESLVSLIREEPSQLPGVRLRLPDPNLCDLLTLDRVPASLVVLTLHLKQLNLSEAAAIANLLSHQKCLQKFRLEGVDRFENDEDEPLGAEDCLKGHKTLLDMAVRIAGSLEAHPHLQSFHLSGRAPLDGSSSRSVECCRRVFARAMERNASLESFQFLFHVGDDDPSKTIQMYLKLNRHGLRKRLLMDGSSSSLDHCWIEAIDRFNGQWSHDRNCVYYLLRIHPSLCVSAARC